MKQVSIVGLGYIGLPTAVLSAQSGYKVFGYDVDVDKVRRINFGDPTIVEPGLKERLAFVISKNILEASNDLKSADCFVVAVPTPFKKEISFADAKQADLSYVFSAGEKISRKLKHGNLVILESTIPVGTTQEFAKILEEGSGLKLGIDFFVAHCPERVLPGKIFQELVENDRVIGGVCEQSSQLAKKFYSKFVKGKLYLTDDKTAEMVKLVENSSRDVQIAFANSLDAMCKKVGINVYNVIEFANKHPRVNILNPGCGVGGHCIAVDPWFLIEKFSNESALLRVSRNVNDEKPNQVVSSVIKAARDFKNNKDRKIKVFLLGLTFKPDVDDTRESPALKIGLDLINDNDDLLNLSVCEPNIESYSLDSLGFKNVKNLQDGCSWADLILILVKHKKFYEIKKLTLKDKIIIDTCGLLYEIEKTEKEVLFSTASLSGERNETVVFK